MNIVKNINPAYSFPLPISPLEYWSEKSKLPAVCCSVMFCYETDIQGCMVRRCNTTDGQVYIVPLCTHHRQSNDELEIGNTRMVRVERKADSNSLIANS